MSSDGTHDAAESPLDAAAERFAAAVDEHGDEVVDDVVGDPDLAHEVALARRLGELGNSLDPDPQARERARRRLLAALERETPGGDGPSRAS